MKNTMPIYIPNIIPLDIPGIDTWMNIEQIEQHIIEYIKNVLSSQLGYIRRVDLLQEIETNTHMYYYKAYCYVDWNKNKKNAEIIQETIINPNEEARIYYKGEEYNQYWVLLENKEPKTKKEANIERLTKKLNHNIDALHNFLYCQEYNRNIRNYAEYQEHSYMNYLYKNLLDLQKEIASSNISNNVR